MISFHGRRRPVHYAWIVTAVTFLTLLAAAGSRSAPGVLLLPLGNEFLWSRAKVSSIVSLNILVFGLMGPFAASFYQTLGLRRTMLLSLALVSAGYGLSTLATHFWEFMVLWGVVVGAGSGMSAMVLSAAVANRWFYSRRGLVVGILTASTATGQLIFLPWFASSVSERGWRVVLLVVVLVCAFVLPVIWIFMRDHPSQMGERAYGETPGAESKERWEGNPAKQALLGLFGAARVSDFWLLSGSFFVCGASTTGLVGTHFVSAGFDCAISEVKSASLLAVMGVFDLGGSILSGWLSDRFNSRYLLFAYYGLRGLSLLFLPRVLVGGESGLWLFALFYGLEWVATVPPTVRLVNEVFGPERTGIVFGWIAASHQFGAAFAAFTAGWLRTSSGTYTMAFLAAGALCLIAALSVLPIGTRSRALDNEPTR